MPSHTHHACPTRDERVRSLQTLVTRRHSLPESRQQRRKPNSHVDACTGSEPERTGYESTPVLPTDTQPHSSWNAEDGARPIGLDPNIECHGGVDGRYRLYVQGSNH